MYVDKMQLAEEQHEEDQNAEKEQVEMLRDKAKRKYSSWGRRRSGDMEVTSFGEA